MIDGTNAGVTPKHRGRRPDRPAPTGVRKLIQDRVQEVGLNLAALSRAVGKNTAYVHQFIYNGTPRRLDGDTRKTLASLLELDEDLLREPMPGYPGNAPRPAQPAASPDQPKTHTDRVPVFLEGQAFGAKPARHDTPMPAFSNGLPDFAIWIETPWGQLNSGDLAFVKDGHPTRPGDKVVVVANERVRCIGEVKVLTSALVTVTVAGSTEQFQRSAVRVLKIIGVAYP